MDAFGDKESHLASSDVTDGVNKDLGAVVLPLPPGVGPAKDDGVGFHATEATSLYPAKYCWYQNSERTAMMDDDSMKVFGENVIFDKWYSSLLSKLTCGRCNR